MRFSKAANVTSPLSSQEQLAPVSPMMAMYQEALKPKQTEDVQMLMKFLETSKQNASRQPLDKSWIDLISKMMKG